MGSSEGSVVVLISLEDCSISRWGLGDVSVSLLHELLIVLDELLAVFFSLCLVFSCWLALLLARLDFLLSVDEEDVELVSVVLCLVDKADLFE